MARTTLPRSVLLAGSLIATASSLVHAQSLCGTRALVLDELAERYGETVVFRGLKDDGTRMIEMTVSTAGTWSIVVSAPEGTTCTIAFGVAGDILKDDLRPRRGV